MKIKKQSNFIKGLAGGIFVQKPTSVGAGKARHKWLNEYFQGSATIVSEKVWNVLSNRYKQETLIEYEDGQFEVKDVD